MEAKRCLYCYQEILPQESESEAIDSSLHIACSKKFFGNSTPPVLPYTEDDLLKLAENIIKSQKVVTGVQPKLSLGIERRHKKEPDRFTIVGLLGEYILKPQTPLYQSLPENEDLTMHLAEIAKIKTVPHSLVYLKSGQLAYITKRVDRAKGKKLHMEDMCQLTERLTEHKYKGSYEQIAKAITRFSQNSIFDVINFYEIVLFSFLTGNSDMHLKNFSLLKGLDLNYNLSPAYDLVSSQLVFEEDDEELALNLNGKKKKLKKQDFEVAMRSAGLELKTIENIFKKFAKAIPQWHEFIDLSFLNEDLKMEYHKIIKAKAKQLDLSKQS